MASIVYELPSELLAVTVVYLVRVSDSFVRLQIFVVLPDRVLVSCCPRGAGVRQLNRSANSTQEVL